MTTQRRPPVLAAIEPRRLYRQVAQVLLDHIDKGLFPPGSFLPPERELANQLGISRTSVREALIALEIQGRVSVRVGSGVTVLTQPSASKKKEDDLPDVGPLGVVDARLLIEIETAGLAAARVGKKEIAALEGVLKQIDKLFHERKNYVALDREFHLKIAEYSGNPALVGVLRLLWDYRKSELFARYETHFVTPALYEKSAADHRLILNALRHNNPTQARAAMRKHLKRVRGAYLKSL